MGAGLTVIDRVGAAVTYLSNEGASRVKPSLLVLRMSSRVRLGAAAAGVTRTGEEASGMSQESWALKTAMRRLWSDHVIWTREYVVAAIKETPDKDAAAARLLRNQE